LAKHAARPISGTCSNSSPSCCPSSMRC
jgi:hypothetical protein